MNPEKMDPKWRELMERHPWSFEHLYFPPECGAGWYDLLDGLMNRIEDVLSGEPKGEWLVVKQIKEKFGGLRFYAEWDINKDKLALADAVGALVTEAEAKSYQICELCGEPGELRKALPWMRTLCSACYQKKKENQ